MGYSVESYSLDELARISLPGAVVPTLFWALPVGAWSHDELDALWRRFTENRGGCRAQGLLLLRTDASRLSDDKLGGSKFVDVAASLKDILPDHAYAPASRHLQRESSRFILCLSGAYPQPGWGVLVSVPHQRSAGSGLEKIVTEALQLIEADGSGHLSGLIAVQSTYRTIEALRSQRNDTCDRIRVLESLELPLAGLKNKINSLVSAVNERRDKDVIQALPSLLRDANALAESNEFHETARDLETQRSFLRNALGVSHAPTAILDILVSTFNDVRTNRIYEKVAMRECSPASRKVLGALLGLRSAFRADLNVAYGGDIQAVAEIVLLESLAKVRESVSRLNFQVSSRLEDVRVNLAPARSDKDRLELEINRLDREFSGALVKAYEIQWELGPRFLLLLEEAARVSGIDTLSIPWDGPRMVGWKLLASGCSITLADVRTVARELKAPPPELSGQQVTRVEDVIDGSYFTDYVHHIAMQLQGSPREVACSVVSSLFKPTELARLAAEFGANVSQEAPRGELADQLLEAMGWKAVRKVKIKPLAALVLSQEASGEEANSISGAHEMRLALESFCKDVIETLTFQLGNNPQRIWAAIDAKVPPYRAASRSRSWSEEIALCTAGSGAIIIERLGESFAAGGKGYSELAEVIGELGRILNAALHHREGVEEEFRAETCTHLIQRALQTAMELFGELPWHFSPAVQFGQGPRVLSGQAWSHAHPTPRLLRVITQTGVPQADDLLVWNRTGTNPIVADPVFIGQGQRVQY